MSKINRYLAPRHVGALCSALKAIAVQKLAAGDTMPACVERNLSSLSITKFIFFFHWQLNGHCEIGPFGSMVKIVTFVHPFTFKIISLLSIFTAVMITAAVSTGARLVMESWIVMMVAMN